MKKMTDYGIMYRLGMFLTGIESIDLTEKALFSYSNLIVGKNHEFS